MLLKGKKMNSLEAPSLLFVPSSEIENRLRHLQEMMAQEGLDAILICQNVDLFYFSGTMQPGFLFIPFQDEPVFFSRKNMERALEESPLTNVLALTSPKAIPSLLAEKGLALPQVLGLEMDVLTANIFLQLQNIFEGSRILDASILIRKCRMIKSPWEIENMERSAQMMTAMVYEISRILRPGMTEIELAGRIEGFLRKEGHQGFTRLRGFNQEIVYGHVLSGPEGLKASYIDAPSGGTGLGPAFSQGAGLKPIQPQEPISVDSVGCYNGYFVDQTRMFSLGQPAAAVKKAFKALLQIQESIVERAQPGVPCEQVYFWALEEAGRLGYRTQFMGMDNNRVSYIGHGVGLELDELPIIGQKFNWPLEPGMVLALEPKIFLSGHGLVGLENTYQMTESGLNLLTTAPDDFQIV
jgi:Xaa-Pro dipeptidase